MVGSSEILVGGELPVEGRHRSDFAQSSTARKNGLLVRQGLTDFPSNGQAEVRQWSLDVS